jgi:hypothetical protein
VAIQEPGAKDLQPLPGQDPPTIFCGNKFGSISAAISQEILWIQVEAEPTGADLVGCMQQAHASGMFALSAGTLVDLTAFRGVIDWRAIYAVRDMAAAGIGREPQSRVAYVSQDRMFGTLMRLLSGLFPNARHRLFSNAAAAVAWLRGPSDPGTDPGRLDTRHPG